MSILITMKEIAVISDRVAISIEAADLNSLQRMLAASAFSSLLGHADEYLVSQMIKPVVEAMASTDNISPELLPKLVDLAAAVNVDFGEFVDRAVAHGTQKQILEIISKGGEKAAKKIVFGYLSAPRESLANAIASTACIANYVDASGGRFAGQPLHKVVQALKNDLGEDACAQAFTAMFEGQKDAKTMLLNIGKYVNIFPGSRILSVAEKLSGTMDLIWRGEGVNHNRNYHGLFGGGSAKEAYETAVEIVNSFLPQIQLKMFNSLNKMADVPFYEHRSLVDHAKSLAESFSALGEDSVLWFKHLCGIVGLKRIHASALRYARRELQGKHRELFDAALCQVGSTVVQDIVKAGLDLNGNESGPIFDPAKDNAAAYDDGARIWPKNYAVATKFYESVNKSVKEFTGICKNEWKRDEDALSERFMKSLVDNVKGLAEDADVKAWIAKKYRYGSIEVSEPVVRDVEDEWGADIGIVVNLKVAGTLNHCWGYLLQAKKAKGSPKPTRWDIDRQQAEDIILRSSASYYLLYSSDTTPGLPYVVPARTILSALDALERKNGNDKKSIPCKVGEALGKPFADFFVEDVIGAWTGEPDSRLVQLISDGHAAKAVIRVTVRLGLDG